MSITPPSSGWQARLSQGYVRTAAAWDNLNLSGGLVRMLTLNRCARYFPALLLFALAVSLANAQKAPIQITADLVGCAAQAISCGDGFSGGGRTVDADFAGVDSGTPYAFRSGVFDYRRGIYGEWKAAGVASGRCESFRVSHHGAERRDDDSYARGFDCDAACFAADGGAGVGER